MVVIGRVLCVVGTGEISELFQGLGNVLEKIFLRDIEMVNLRPATVILLVGVA